MSTEHWLGKRYWLRHQQRRLMSLITPFTSFQDNSYTYISKRRYRPCWIHDLPILKRIMHQHRYRCRYTHYAMGWTKYRFLVSGGKTMFSAPKGPSLLCAQTGCFVWGKAVEMCDVATRLHLVPRLRMSRTVSPHSHKPSWCSRGKPKYGPDSTWGARRTDNSRVNETCRESRSVIWILFIY
jgi:hypothetical protein